MTTALAGRVLDVDTHEMIPMHLWPEHFGPVGERMAVLEPYLGNMAENSQVRPDLVADDVPIGDESVWRLKGPGAPSAIDLGRRPAVMDHMGVARQLVFPTFALDAIVLVSDPGIHARWGLPADVDAVELGTAAIAAHNEWAARVTRTVDGSRLRPVGVVLTDDLDGMIADAERALAAGVRGIWIPSGSPPAGLSPADRRLAPFYRLFEEADVPLLLHLGTELAGFATWSAGCPEFVPSASSSVEFPLQPYTAATLRFTPENFLTVAVLGGVFERHADLRFGAIESGAGWIGPLAESLDLWATQFRRLDVSLAARPSEYLARNVRVTPFVFEPVDRYLDRHPDLASVYCYSSDFPHREGGHDAYRQFDERLAGVDADTRERFFVGNGAWLLPD